MTKNNYTLRLCSVGSCTSAAKVQGYCPKHYMQHKRGGIKEPASACKACGVSLEGRQSNTVYCGQLCKRKAWDAANPEKIEERRKRETAKRKPKPKSMCAVHFCSCKSCGKAFTCTYKRLHCSYECEFASRDYVLARPLIMNCRGCGAAYSPVRTRGSCSVYCTDECLRVAHRIQKKSYGSNCNRKRARKYGAYYEPVNPIKVFDRDKWICQLCGIKTPKALRNTYEDNAPELDHIIPISLKGAHSYLNTQCSCRKCNSAKSNKPLGQLLMFG